jgi:hypothetical protein
MAKRFVAELPIKQVLWRRLEIVDPRPAESFLTDAVSY